MAQHIRHGLAGSVSPPSWPAGEDGDGEADVVEAEAEVYSPSRFDPVARAASTVIGGPAGRRLASAVGFWGAAPILVLLSGVTLALGLLQKQHCRAQGWSSPDQFWHACYSDIPVLYSSRALGAHPRPSLGHALGSGGLGQSPLAGTMMWLTSRFVSNSPTAGREYFDLSAVLLTLALVVAVAAVAFTAGSRSWDAAHLALSPVIITAGLISYELLAVALTALALLALARARPVLGGLLFGLAVDSAPQVALLGLVVAVLAARYLYQRQAGLVFAGSALGCWFVVRILLLTGLTGGLGPAFRSWRDSVPGYGSFWLVPQLLGASNPQPATSIGGRAIQGLFGWIFDVGALGGRPAAVLSVFFFVILAAGVVRYTILADPPAERDDFATFVTDRVAPLTLALLAVLLLTIKSLPVQESLLLLPFIALSGLPWRDHLIWAATEVVYFVGVWLYIGGDTTPSHGLPASFYLILLLARLAGIGWVGAQGVQAYRRAALVDVWPEPGYGPTGAEAFSGEQISSQADDAGRLLTDRGVPVSHHAG